MSANPEGSKTPEPETKLNSAIKEKEVRIHELEKQIAKTERDTRVSKIHAVNAKFELKDEMTDAYLDGYIAAMSEFSQKTHAAIEVPTKEVSVRKGFFVRNYTGTDEHGGNQL